MSREIRRIVMFHTIEICNNTLNLFSDRVAMSLRSKGIDVGFINLNAHGPALADEYIREMNKGFDAALAFNSSGQHETSMQDDNVFEYMQVPFFNWILDHPCEHIADIRSNVKDYHIICLDRDHVNYVKRYFPNIAGVHFLPLGGEKASEEIDFSKEAFKNRKYDISFTGSCFSLERLGSIIGNLPEELRLASVDMIEAMCDNRSLNNEEAFRYALQKNNIAFDDELFVKYSQLTAKTNPFVRSYIRLEVIQYLASSGIKMHLFGDGWDNLEDSGNIVIHNSIPYTESVKCTADSKISLNIMPLFKDGLHDRIPTAMLNGSAVVTDGSVYINEIFRSNDPDKELYTYDIAHPESVADVLMNALEDIDSLYDVAQRGRQKAEKSLTWDSRIDELIGILRT